ncbi:MAG: hypothetical protein COA78_34330 [Blastopirellula sp.]|nr:MAG: hypothetical protein COA78_34330 [Blastopirellula sp.]
MPSLQTQYIDAMEASKRATAFRKHLAREFPASKKSLIQKSALINGVAAVRDRDGNLLGFFPAERIDYRKMKSEIAKSIHSEVDKVHADENSVMDSLFDFDQPGLVEDVQKSAEDSDSGISPERIFPPCLQPN